MRVEHGADEEDLEHDSPEPSVKSASIAGAPDTSGAQTVAYEFRDMRDRDTQHRVTIAQTPRPQCSCQTGLSDEQKLGESRKTWSVCFVPQICRGGLYCIV